MDIPQNIDETIKVLERTLFSLHPENESVYNSIQALKEFKNKPANSYNAKDTIAGKIIFALNELKRFSTASDILRTITDIDPAFNGGLSTALTNLRENGTVIVIKPSGSNREVYYGLPNWTNEQKQPLPECMYQGSYFNVAAYKKMRGLERK
ncbi:MAG: hypothetical protein JSU01_06345 [Bacteroidetes bacterium]|nr:hypothetical protein [Bacteroidota bacterium]